MILQMQQLVYDEMREEFETMGSGGRYNQEQKNYALGLIDEYGVRATARILHLPRRTLQRWCRGQGKYVRWWFLCPLSRNGVSCGRRVAKLYRAPRADYYGCRDCYDLSYESRNESRRGRFAHMDHFLMLNRRREKLMEEMTRWAYRGIPTRKARRLQILDARLKAYGKAHLADLM